MLLDAGSLVAADGRLLECHNLQMNESSLTGESLPVEKRSGVLKTEAEPPLGDQSNMAFTGSLVTGGRGVFVVTATGMETELGKIAGLMNAAKERKTPLQESLDKLRLDYIDLWLMHWPVPAIDHYVDAWKGMIELQKEGLVKSIGVCNFQVHHLQRLIDETGVVPVINQIELHPLMQQRQLHAWNATHKIQTESWSPLAQGGEGVFDQKIIRDLADKYGKTPAQIVIRWHLDNGLVVIPKSVTPSRIAENFDVWDFRLDKDELGEIAKLDQGKRLGPDPDQFGG